MGQIAIPATYMRGGTSKGVFFRLEDLPEAARVSGPARDRLFQRVIGSPDPYGAQIDGMGGATSSTSKCVILSPSTREGHDVDYLYGQVSIDADFVDWSGNCGNLSTAAGAFAIHAGYVDAGPDGSRTVRIWQANIGKTIIAHVPVSGGAVLETGDFELDGVTFPAAEIVLEFVDPADEGEDGGAMFPTGNLVDELEVPEAFVAGGKLKATLINAGIPTIFVDAAGIGYTGTELREAINGDAAALARFEILRTIGALKMGLIDTPEDAAKRQHTPKIAFVAPPRDHVTSSGRNVRADEIDVLVRALSMGKLHHAMMGTASVAIAAAAAVPGTLVNLAAGGGERRSVTFGHPSGCLRVGAEAALVDGRWTVTKAIMSRSARILMEGRVRVPADSLEGDGDMISNRREHGLDLLDAMVSAAADRASAHLPGTIRCARCERVQLNEGFCAPDVDLETWSVSADHQAIVVSVFATAPQAGGGRTMAASGRFTFTTLTHKREYAA